MALRAFPVLYASDVESVAAFYVALGFEEGFRMPDDTGAAFFMALRPDAAELGVTTEASPRILAGVEPGPGPRHELFVYVEDIDAAFAMARDAGGRARRERGAQPEGRRRVGPRQT